MLQNYSIMCVIVLKSTDRDVVFNIYQVRSDPQDQSLAMFAVFVYPSATLSYCFRFSWLSRSYEAVSPQLCHSYAVCLNHLSASTVHGLDLLSNYKTVEGLTGRGRMCWSVHGAVSRH